jgi:pimeloyl-ACP methyl ester carboxylesterase
MARVIIIPGLGVRSYVDTEAAALTDDGHDVDLLPAPSWRGQHTDLGRYGKALADKINSSDEQVDLLIGLSAGTQAAAVAAAQTPLIKRLLLVGPTVDPAHRTRSGVIRAWRAGEDHPDGPKLRRQARDWLKAGLPNLYRGLMSTITVRLEDVLPRVSADITIVHGDSDLISPLDFSIMLAETVNCRMLIMPDAPHSWPIADHDRFRAVVADLLSRNDP